MLLLTVNAGYRLTDILRMQVCEFAVDLLPRNFLTVLRSAATALAGGAARRVELNHRLVVFNDSALLVYEEQAWRDEGGRVGTWLRGGQREAGARRILLQSSEHRCLFAAAVSKRCNVCPCRFVCHVRMLH